MLRLLRRLLLPRRCKCCVHDICCRRSLRLARWRYKPPKKALLPPPLLLLLLLPLPLGSPPLPLLLRFPHAGRTTPFLHRPEGPLLWLLLVLRLQA